jgi:hypothetical protein
MVEKNMGSLRKFTKKHLVFDRVLACEGTGGLVKTVDTGAGLSYLH